MENAIGFSQRIQNFHRAAVFQLLPKALPAKQSRVRAGLMPGSDKHRLRTGFPDMTSPPWTLNRVQTAKTRNSMQADLLNPQLMHHGPSNPFVLPRLRCDRRPGGYGRRKKYPSSASFTPRPRLGIPRSLAVRPASPVLPGRAGSEWMARILPD